MAATNETDRGFNDDSHSKSADMQWGSIGMLFEGLCPTVTKGFLWELSSTVDRNFTTTLSESQIEWEQRDVRCKHEAWMRCKEKNSRKKEDEKAYCRKTSFFVCAVIRCIDDIPGAVASGHYLWPSALSLCDHLVANRLQTLPIRSILELGAGCGIASIVASQFFGETLEVVVVTDNDPTTLARAKENWESSMEERRGFCGGADVRTEFLELEWGSKRDWENFMECLSTESHENTKTETPISFDLILGSDLIDRKEVVEPLFSTANAALGISSHIGSDNDITINSKGAFLLSQSFVYDSETEAEIDRVCERFGLVRRILQNELPVSNRDGATSEKRNIETFTNFVRIQEFARK